MNALGDWSGTIFTASTWVLPVLLAITLHEAAHGFVALRFGDDTALREGRVTLNPLKHVDPFGTIVLPALLILMRSPFMFGYAKPVPVNFGRLRQPRRDMIWVALAGPGMNVLLALVAGLLFALGASAQLFENRLGDFWFVLNAEAVLIPQTPAAWAAKNLVNAVLINALLCVFNMLPLPPLDGGRVAVGILPNALAFPLARLEPFGIPILLLVLFVLPLVGSQLGVNLNLVGPLIMAPTEALIRLVLLLTGQGS